MNKTIKVFAPATIANLSCGFDVLGCCLEGIGDEMRLTLVSNSGVRIVHIEGAELPFESDKNVASVAARALLDALRDTTTGVEITLHKRIKAGSGIGSSAASSAGAVWALNQLLGCPFNDHELIPFAMQGELRASGNAHADNVAPALLGGFTLVRSYSPIDVIALPAPEEIAMTVIHPHIEVKTSDSRAVLKSKISLSSAVQQWGNLGGFVSSLYTEDYDLLGRSLQDVIIEPLRAILIPEFETLKKLAITTGALGCGISGSGPSVYALSQGMDTAKAVGEAFQNFYLTTGLPFEIHTSKINTTGVKILSS